MQELDSWDREWDKNNHTSDEYRQQIREQRERIRFYMNENAALRQAISTIYTVAMQHLRN